MQFQKRGPCVDTVRCRYVSGLPAHPAEQSPVGAASPAALQYFPGGQGSQPPLLDTPILMLKVPAGHWKATPDRAPVNQCPPIRSTDGLSKTNGPPRSGSVCFVHWLQPCCLPFCLSHSEAGGTRIDYRHIKHTVWCYLLGLNAKGREIYEE